MLLMLACVAGIALLGGVVRFGWPPSFLGGQGGQGGQGSVGVSGQNGLVAQLPTSTGPTPTADCSAGIAWRVVNSPNLVPDTSGASSAREPAGGEPGEADDKGGNNLADVAAVAANDVWAVGYRHTKTSVGPLVEHWDGKAWSVAYIRNVTAKSSMLSSVAASGNQAWAVGSYTSRQRVTLPLIEHWDGTQWAITPAAQISSTYALFNGVAVTSSNDAWAVGYSSDARGTYHTLAQHWDGKEWRTVPTPNSGTVLNMLTGVAALSPDDAWAVGYYVTEKSTYKTMTQHWDGKEWRIVDSPNPGKVTNYLYDVAIAAPNDAWAVGYSFDGSGPTAPLLLHWNGKEWLTAQAPPVQSTYAVLNGISLVPGGGLWVAGMYQDKSRVYRSLLAHWDGAAWGTVASPGSGVDLSTLKAVAALSATDAWAVGYHNLALGEGSTLTAHYGDPCGGN